MTANTFREAYAVLQRHAETLRNQREPNIDDLLTIVTESVGAYKVCKERIDAVERALEQALGGAGVDAAGETLEPQDNGERVAAAAPTVSLAGGAGAANPDDDLPF